MRPIYCLLIALVLPLMLGAAATETIDARRGVQDPCDNTVWYDGGLLRLEGKAPQRVVREGGPRPNGRRSADVAADVPKGALVLKPRAAGAKP